MYSLPMKKRESYLSAWTRIYGRDVPGDAGWTEEVLSGAEARLGFPIPESLRQFFAALGNRWEVMEAHLSFFDPTELRLENEKLVFCSNCHSAMLFAVDIDAADPMVHIADDVVANEDRPFVEWRPWARTCAAYLESVIYIQAVLGGCEHLPVLQAPTDAVRRRIAAEWELVVDREGILIWIRDGMLICGGEPGCSDDVFYGACNTETALAILINEYGFKE